MSDPTPKDPEVASGVSEHKAALLSLGAVIGLVLFWALVQPAVREQSAQSASETMIDTLAQAEDRLTTHFPDGDFSTLDNEVLRQVAFSGQGRPVSPAQPLLVRGGAMGLGATPSREGRGFALIVDGARKAECHKIVQAYPYERLQVNGRDADQDACLLRGNLIRIEVLPANEKKAP